MKKPAINIGILSLMLLSLIYSTVKSASNYYCVLFNRADGLATSVFKVMPILADYKNGSTPFLTPGTMRFEQEDDSCVKHVFEVSWNKTNLTTVSSSQLPHEYTGNLQMTIKETVKKRVNNQTYSRTINSSKPFHYKDDGSGGIGYYPILPQSAGPTIQGGENAFEVFEFWAYVAGVPTACPTPTPVK